MHLQDLINSVPLGDTVTVMEPTPIHETLVIPNGVNFDQRAPLLWKGPKWGVCVESDVKDVICDADWGRMWIDTGPDFEGEALAIHSVHGLDIRSIRLDSSGDQSVGVSIRANSIGGGKGELTKRNVTALRIGKIDQHGDVGTIVETGGMAVGYGGNPQVTTLSHIGLVYSERVWKYGLHFKNWTDSWEPFGLLRPNLVGNGAVGIQVGGGPGVYDLHFGLNTVDSFGSAGNRIAMRLTNTKLVTAKLYNHPVCEDGPFVTTGTVTGYDVQYMRDSDGTIVPYSG